MEVKYEGCDETFLRGKMLVLPAEGIGNVGQLAVRRRIKRFSLGL